MIVALHLILKNTSTRRQIFFENFLQKTTNAPHAKKLPSPPTPSDTITTIKEKKEKKNETDTGKPHQKENLNENFLPGITESPSYGVLESNYYPFNENDANFQSNVMNLNRFYRKNADNEPVKETMETKNTNNAQKHPQKYNTNTADPTSWLYKNELPMNGGEILPGITGYDSLTDQYSPFTGTISSGNCSPPNRGTKTNDDLRMGLGTINIENRLTS
jgi:hypothetical protein